MIKDKYRQSPDWPYHDIVNLSHHVSATHPQMTLMKRAAQFAPFAALTGYDEVIEESTRLTDTMTELDEGILEEINRRVAAAMEQKQAIRITYFVPDVKKAGGAYLDVCDRIKKIDQGEIVMENGRRIPVEMVKEVAFEE